MVTGLTAAKTLTVLFDGDCGVCTAVSRALVRLDSGATMTFQPLDAWSSIDGPSHSDLVGALHVVDDRGRWFSGARATVEIARRVPALRPVALVSHLPGAMIVLEWGYRLVAGHRQALSRLLGLRACAVPRRRAGSV